MEMSSNVLHLVLEITKCVRMASTKLSLRINYFKSIILIARLAKLSHMYVNIHLKAVCIFKFVSLIYPL